MYQSTQANSSRVFVFIDGQNLFRSVKSSFGYSYPNYDPIKLANAVNEMGISETKKKRNIANIFYYTGVPPFSKDREKNLFWKNKFSAMERLGIQVFSRELKYTDKEFLRSNIYVKIFDIPHEKGIDVKLALDLVKFALQNMYDIAIIFSCDSDLDDAVKEVYEVGRMQGRTIELECAFPFDTSKPKIRGLNKTKWIYISKGTYDECIDPCDYRPKNARLDQSK